MRQRLFKAISCIALMVSVFFCNPLNVLADDSFGGDIVVEGVSQEYDLSTLAELGPNDYTGVTSIHTQTSYAFYEWSNRNLGDPFENFEHFTNFTVDVPVNFRLDVERGHTYSGQVYFQLHVTFPDPSTSQFVWRYSFVGLGGFEQQSLYDGITVSYYGFVNFGTVMNSGTCDVMLCVTFDNYQPTFTGTLNVNSSFELVGSLQTMKSPSGQNYAGIPRLYCPCSVSSDWAGELYDYSTDVIVDSDGSLIKNQTIQQQQIANQQSQQSAQQHDNLVNGYDNAANDNMLADKNSVLKGFEQQQDQAMSDGQQYVADFSANYDTAPLQAMAPAFMMISTWFNDLWGGMGNFSTVLIVGLMLCVAGYILKLKH